MIVKSYKKENVEIIVTKTGDDYKVIRLVGGNESIVTSILDQESAFDIFDYFIDMEMENDK